MHAGCCYNAFALLRFYASTLLCSWGSETGNARTGGIGSLTDYNYVQGVRWVGSRTQYSLFLLYWEHNLELCMQVGIAGMTSW